MSDVLYTVIRKDGRIGPLPLSALADRLRKEPAPDTATVIIHTRLGDRFSPISHLPELAQHTVSANQVRKDPPACEIYGPHPHKPNHIPLKERFGCCLLILIYIFLCYWGFIEGKVFFPAGRHSPGWYVSGPVGFWAAELSHFCVIASCITILVDHFDKRANELSYKWFNRGFLVAAFALAIIAFAVGQVEKRKATFSPLDVKSQRISPLPHSPNLITSF